MNEAFFLPRASRTNYRGTVLSCHRTTAWCVPLAFATLLFHGSVFADDPVAPYVATLVKRAEKALQLNAPVEAAGAHRDALELQADETTRRIGRSPLFGRKFKWRLVQRIDSSNGGSGGDPFNAWARVTAD